MQTVRRIINEILGVKGLGSLGSSLYQTPPPPAPVRQCNLCVNMTVIFAVMSTVVHYY